MPTYATRADCLDYTQGLVVDDNALFDKLIERAERDVDAVIGARPIGANGLKFDPLTLTTEQAAALKRATCAQVEYRVEMGEAFFTRGQFDQESGPDFSKSGKLPYYAPKLRQELRGSGLVRAQRARATI